MKVMHKEELSVYETIQETLPVDPDLESGNKA